MSTNRRIKGQVCLPLSLVLFAPFGTVAAAGSNPSAAAATPVFTVLIAEKTTAIAVRRALSGAYERLAEPSCQAVLSDFEDAAGQPLKSQLDARERTAQDYLSEVVFQDGSRFGPCRRRRILAFTVPGSPDIYICPKEFSKRALRDPVLGPVAVIHEVLHTLGLGENPPSPAYITSRVFKRCGG